MDAWLDSRARLSCGAIVGEAQCRAYLRDGYMVLPGVFGRAEMDALGAEADALARRGDLIAPGNLRCRYRDHWETGEKLFETFDPVADLSPLIWELAHDTRLLRVLHGIYGEPACLFKDKLIFKPSGATGYDLHRDFADWPGFPRSFVTVLLAIDPSDTSNGCTEIVPMRGDARAGTEADDCVPLLLAPGDVAVFGAFTPHRSGPNRCSTSRRHLFLSYNALSEGGDQRTRHYQQFGDYLRAHNRPHDGTEFFFR